MKKIIVLILVALLGTTALVAQDLIALNKTVSNENSKIIYIGIENEFELQGRSIKDVIPHHGVVLKGNKMRIRATSVGKLSVTFILEDGNKQIDFTVKRVPDITIVVDGKTKEEISKGIQGRITFKTSNDEDGFYADYRVSSYKATFNGKIYEVSGDKLPGELTTAIASTKSNDVLIISNVKGFNEKVIKSVNLNGSFEFGVE